MTGIDKLDTFPIPDVVLEDHVAILGKTGSGKTSTEKLIIERVVAQGYRVCILDPVKSDWWGLTSSSDGKSPALPFTILGGPHGHAALHSSAGKVVGQLVGSGKLRHSIIDMADFEAGGLQKFFVEFAQSLLRSINGIVYLVIEEAHEFAPKERAGFGSENMALHLAKKLATAGRSKGLRLIVATQRVQSLHNAVLGSCETLIAHRLNTPADQEPVLKWLKVNGSKKDNALVAESLSSLPKGTGWVCSGQAKMFEKIAFPKFQTYDNTATPTKEGKRHDVEIRTAAVDVEQLKAILGDAVEDAKANDPKALKAEIAKLRNEAIQAEKLRKAPAPEIDVQAVQKKASEDGYTAGSLEGYAEGYKKGHRDGMLEFWSMAREKISQTLVEIETNIPRGEPEPKLPAKKPLAIGIGAHEGPIAGTMTHGHNLPELKPSQRELPATSQAAISPSGRKIIDMIHKAYPISLSFEAAAHRAGVSKRSSAYRIYRNEVRESSELEVAGSGFRSKPEFAATEQLDPQATIQQWVSRLPPSFGKMLQAIADGHTTKQEIAHAAGVSPTSSGLSGGLRELLGLDLIYNVDGGFYLSEGLSA